MHGLAELQQMVATGIIASRDLTKPVRRVGNRRQTAAYAIAARRARGS